MTESKGIELNDETLDMWIRNPGKMRILDATIALSKEQDFESLSVVSICKRAGVSRQNFYHHFTSKYDAITWLWRQMVAEDMDRLGVDRTWREALQRQYSHTREYFIPFMSTLTSGPESSQNFGEHYRRDSLKRVITQHIGATLTPELEFQIDCFSVGEAWMVQRALTSSQPIDGEAFARKMLLCVPQELRELIDSAVLSARAQQEAES